MVDPKQAPPRVGVFFCRCDGAVSDYADLEAAAENIKANDPNVVHVRVFNNLCKREDPAALKEDLTKYGIERVVVGACACCSLEHHCSTCHLQRDRCRENVTTGASVERSLYEFISIREHVAWVHKDDMEDANLALKRMTAMAAAKASMLEPYDKVKTASAKSAMVAGAGPGSITAALTLADLGFDVKLFDASFDIDEWVDDKAAKTTVISQAQISLKDAVKLVKGHPKVKIFNSAKVIAVGGSVGKFEVTFDRDGFTGVLTAGVVLVGDDAKSAGGKGRAETFATRLPPQDGYFRIKAAKEFAVAVVQGSLAATQAGSILSQGGVTVLPFVAEIVDENCIGCNRCDVCPFGAIGFKDTYVDLSMYSVENYSFKSRKATVDPALCTGCGMCAMECTCLAIEMVNLSDAQMTAMAKAYMRTL
jgi:heterodisulfide reductase subunit A-like polyferredoxin